MEILLFSLLRRKYNTDFFGQHIQSPKLLQTIIFEPNLKNMDKNIENTRVRIQIMKKVFLSNSTRNVLWWSKRLLSSWSRIYRLPQWALEYLSFFCESCKRQNAVRLDMSSQHSWNILYLSVLFLCTVTWLEAKRRRHLDGLLFWDVFLMILFEFKNLRYYNDSWTSEILSHSKKIAIYCLTN